MNEFIRLFTASCLVGPWEYCIPEHEKDIFKKEKNEHLKKNTYFACSLDTHSLTFNFPPEVYALVFIQSCANISMVFICQKWKNNLEVWNSCLPWQKPNVMNLFTFVLSLYEWFIEKCHLVMLSLKLLVVISITDVSMVKTNYNMPFKNDLACVLVVLTAGVHLVQQTNPTYQCWFSFFW
jgi:hypothetical protein